MQGRAPPRDQIFAHSGAVPAHLAPPRPLSTALRSHRRSQTERAHRYLPPLHDIRCEGKQPPGQEAFASASAWFADGGVHTTEGERGHASFLKYPAARRRRTAKRTGLPGSCGRQPSVSGMGWDSAGLEVSRPHEELGTLSSSWSGGCGRVRPHSLSVAPIPPTSPHPARIMYTHTRAAHPERERGGMLQAGQERKKAREGGGRLRITGPGASAKERGREGERERGLGEAS
jgi:hypothetical protein